MAGEKVKFESPDTDEGRKNDRSSISFPYLDLDTAISVARGIYQRAGLGSCELDELAAEMGQTVSGAFRLKTATARTFGLWDRDGKSGMKLTDLGQQIIQGDTEREARAKAFLAIPLYAKIFETYKGKLLPPAKALEREMGALGVATKQTDRARQIFERSAEQAGFFASGDDRLVQPRFDRTQTPKTRDVDDDAQDNGAREHKRNGGGGGVGGGGGSNKPLEYQLVDLLKRPGIQKDVSDAIWKIVQYLTTKNENGDQQN